MPRCPTLCRPPPRHSQVTTTGGAAVITMDRGQALGLVQHANGTVWNVTKDYKSGFFSSWNKASAGKR